MAASKKVVNEIADILVETVGRTKAIVFLNRLLNVRGNKSFTDTMVRLHARVTDKDVKF